MTEPSRLMRDFLRDDAGTPLGAGMPSGGPLRADGQSHYEAWQSLPRRDPCSYCGAVGASGTIDHVDPRSRRGGACAGGPTRPPPSCAWGGPDVAGEMACRCDERIGELGRARPRAGSRSTA